MLPGSLVVGNVTVVKSRQTSCPSHAFLDCEPELVQCLVKSFCSPKNTSCLSLAAAPVHRVHHTSPGFRGCNYDWCQMRSNTLYTLDGLCARPSRKQNNKEDIRQLEEGKRARTQDLLTSNGKQLDTWKELYLVEAANVRKVNYERIKTFCIAEDNVSFNNLLKHSNTFRTVLRVFERDLDYITLSVWLEHRGLILREYACIPSRSNPNGKTRCPICNRLVKTAGLCTHLVDKHPDVDPNTVPRTLLPAQDRDKMHCMQCPPSKRWRTFDKDALVCHKRSKHPQLQQ
ncbi:Inositol-pentakisphosphate 2-kinase [Mycena indigotica]|uniref:Inositol-pentakisphosphate 2-kinase n=1 Tax=Mycena indigotica TaxID=2126181 RepID=A0A8H6RZR1_9AGAR|nr:Inositol-pentakisphosphate 2-kinase [Mycena indigotica]KAF7289242.1 Inositol-pentakisphosphate 2-kinase [Mycena indigotica]